MPGPVEITYATCTWPDGSTARVAVISEEGGAANVIWNDQVNGRVTGFDETVPSSWLSDRVINTYYGPGPSSGSTND